ncbi:hypothetical protein [Desulfosporosinus sp. BG]|uniref:hypothetical protein n=1 Tax=Desulfosporosinus sp. BG TaxID=1633135 RepID=UPI00114CE1B5|nr:hypothetical protein [Desulfosporosinus sp. BG]
MRPKTLSSHVLVFLQDGIAFDQNNPEVLRFSLSDKRIGMQRVDHDSLRWRLSPKALTHNEQLTP